MKEQWALLTTTIEKNVLKAEEEDNGASADSCFFTMLESHLKKGSKFSSFWLKEEYLKKDGYVAEVEELFETIITCFADAIAEAGENTIRNCKKLASELQKNWKTVRVIVLFCWMLCWIEVVDVSASKASCFSL
jgi:hypothetical protein